MAITVAPSRSTAARIFRSALISGMVACIAQGWVILLEILMPGWSGSHIVLVAALVSFETLLVEAQIHASNLERSNRLPVRLAEIGVILLLIKPLSYLDRGWAAFVSEASGWLTAPWSFFGGDFVLAAAAAVLFWISALDIARALALLDDYTFPADQSNGLDLIKSHFLVGAYILLLAIGLRHIDFVITGTPMPADMIAAQVLLPILYLVIGLLLLGQARLSLLQTNWLRDAIPIDPRLGRRWVTWGTVLVGGIGLVALFLPAGNTIAGFFLFLTLLHIIQTIGGILLILVLLILSPCAALLQLSPPGSDYSARPTPLPPPPAQPQAVAFDWLLQLRVLAVWLVIIAAIFLIVRIYWRDRSALMRGGWRGALSHWMRSLWLALVGWRKRVVLRWPGRATRRTVTRTSPALGLLERWRARTARERVRRLYLLLLQRAARSGYPRKMSQTPLEYAAELEPEVPQEREAVETLTGAFNEARYSRRDFAPDEVSLLQRVWEGLQRALKRKKENV